MADMKKVYNDLVIINLYKWQACTTFNVNDCCQIFFDLKNCFVLDRFHCNILTIFFKFYSQETLGVRGQPRQYKRGWSHCFASGKLQFMNIIINRYNKFQLIIQLIIQLISNYSAALMTARR